MTGKRRFMMPLLLAGLGVYLLVGCIYVPTFNATIGGKDATKAVGLVGSTKRLLTGMSTRVIVRRVLGEPYFATSDGRFMVYSWKRQKGLVVWPLCFAAEPEAKAFAMTLEFGSDGVMTAFDLESQQAPGYLFSPPNAPRFKPMRVTLHQQELDLRDQPHLLEQFRATTRSIRPTTQSAQQYK
jgi:hypothetical protein